jgi:glycosyltransferase involved in cell wall biosynthesis
MNKVKEVIVFTNGDSSEIATWSNVPFFFTQTLESKGIKVNRVNIAPSPVLRTIFNKACHPIVKLLYKNTSYDYFRSLIHFKDVRARIKKAVERYSRADAHIFLTFSFSSAGLTSKPVIQFCDWTYDHYFNYFLKRQPDPLEIRSVRREDGQLNGADLIIPLFPGVTEYMKKRYTGEKVFYLGNVINSLFEVSDQEIETLKGSSNDLLFIGSQKYMEGARSLIAAFSNLKKEIPDLRLNIIGMKTTDFDSLPDGVFCHGYLDKGKEDQRNLYYSILKRSKVFINTTPKWGAFSATIEAMYFSIPVIVTPYDEFLETFGREINFGAFCENNIPSGIEEKIRFILGHPAYKTLSRNAHLAVKSFTWDAYIDKLLSKIETLSR